MDGHAGWLSYPSGMIAAMDYGLALTLTLGAIYMAPTLLAMLVRHRNRWTIAVFNALLGWTIIGYLPVLYLLMWPLTWHGQLSRRIDDLNRQARGTSRRRGRPVALTAPRQLLTSTWPLRMAQEAPFGCTDLGSSRPRRSAGDRTKGPPAVGTA